MTKRIAELSSQELNALATALRSGRLSLPASEASLTRILHPTTAQQIIPELATLADLNFTSEQMAVLLSTVHTAKQTRRRPEDLIDVVTTGPEAPGVSNRDTGAAVRELFSRAEQSVLVAGYAIYQGDEVFRTLAHRLRDNEELDVRFYLNISRPDGNTERDSILVHKFVNRLKETQWPKDCPLPSIFYDPRSLELNKNSSLHAKCVVVDEDTSFVSSANFTNAGQERNIEVGLLVRSPVVAKQLTQHFAHLVHVGLMREA